MSSELRLCEFSPALPELESERWRSFDAEEADELAWHRALLVAHAACVESPFLIASAWSPSHELEGIAVGVVETHARGQRILSLRVPAAMRGRHAPGVFVRSDLARGRVTAGLLKTMLGEAGRRGLRRVALSQCPEADVELARAAEDLGGRAFPAPPEYRIELAPEAGLDSYLGALGTRRRWKREHDLERARRAGAELADLPASTELLKELDPLLRDRLRRFDSPLGATGENLLLKLSEHAGAENLVVTTLRDASGLLGFLLAHRTTTSTRFVYLAHVESERVHVAAALWAQAIPQEIRRGARRLYLGMTSDVLKRRMGASAIVRRHYIFET